ncbi:PAS domain-containing protein [Streptomyces flavotricini]|uniref:PAS domain-containing protein n=1 Tax=Streptomyces flavotricini TaxID=66888 RepID=A0ABS8DXR1_9ACTN|nr:PAS domain-containing protein [Streptomyces flavotricini]MCC0093618.1 PAS domain-containing protein [Streptomyces flavotricini]
MEPSGQALGEAATAWRSRFVSLFDRAPVALAISDAYGLILGANPAFASAWQLQPGKLEGRRLLDILTPTNDRQLRRLDEALRSRRRSRYPVEVTWQVRGTARHGRVTVEPVSDPQDDVPRLLVSLTEELTGEPGGGRSELPPEDPADGLSLQEARILPLVAAGAAGSAIAREVGLTVDGVNYHVTRLCRRLDVPNRPALIARAYVLGLLDPAAWPPRVAAAGPERA